MVNSGLSENLTQKSQMGSPKMQHLIEKLDLDLQQQSFLKNEALTL